MASFWSDEFDLQLKTAGMVRPIRPAIVRGETDVSKFANPPERKRLAMKSSAAVLNEVGAPFTVTDIDVSDPAPDEVLVKIAGVGMCHTDVAVKEGHLPFPFPGVLGHEGSGTVEAVGANVTSVSVGDAVVLSFNSCGDCPHCTSDEPAYCHNFLQYNFGGGRADGSSGLASNGTPLAANFFGQSSFGSYALAHERNVVKLPPGAPLELAGPLGCGIQTGAGAVLNALDVQPGSTLVIAGAGPVGLSGLLGAVVREAATIVVVEPHQNRRDLATELGATYVIDPAAGDLTEQLRAILPAGADFALDTTAAAPVVESLLAALGMRGTLGLVGVAADPAATFSAGLFQPTLLGLTIRGIVEGDSNPKEFIPYLLDLHAQGRFPFDRLITTMPMSQINDGLAAQLSGEAIKVVLTP